MSEEDNIQRVHDRVALLNARDFPTYVKPLDDSFVGEGAAAPEGVHGPTELQQQLEMMIGAFPDLKVEIEKVIASGDHVVTCVKLSGTHKGTYAGIPATNRAVSWGVCSVSELRDGKTIKTRLYGDNGSLLRQIGAVMIPGAAPTE